MKDIDFKEKLKDVSFSWYGDDPTNATNQMKTSNIVHYQILENGSKTIHQYWLADGA